MTPINIYQSGDPIHPDALIITSEVFSEPGYQLIFSRVLDFDYPYTPMPHDAPTPSRIEPNTFYYPFDVELADYFIAHFESIINGSTTYDYRDYMDQHPGPWQ